MALFEYDHIASELATGATLVDTIEASLGEILARPKTASDNPRLLEQRARLRVFEIACADVFSLDLPDTFYASRDLMYCLNGARARRNDGNRPGMLSRAGIVGDWIMPDRQGYSEYRRLATEHLSGMRGDWTTFITGDRLLFMAALTHPDGDDLNQLMNHALRDPRLLTIVQAKQLQDQAESRLDQDDVDCRLKNSTSPGSGNVTISFQDLPESAKQTLVEQARNNSLWGKIVVDSNDPSYSLKLSYTFDGIEGSKAYIGGGLVEIKIGDVVYGVYDFNGEEPKEVQRIDTSDNKYALSPWIVWARSKTSNRRLYLDRPGLILPETILEGVDTRANRRLGFLAATSLSDEERDRLPQQLALKPGGKKQPIQEPQMPLLVYLEEYQRALLQKGAFFSNVEITAGFPLAREVNLPLPSLEKMKKFVWKASAFIGKTLIHPVIHEVIAIGMIGYGLVDGGIVTTSTGNDFSRRYKAEVERIVETGDSGTVIEKMRILIGEDRVFAEDVTLKAKYPLNRGTRNAALIVFGLALLGISLKRE